MDYEKRRTHLGLIAWTLIPIGIVLFYTCTQISGFLATIVGVSGLVALLIGSIALIALLSEKSQNEGRRP